MTKNKPGGPAPITAAAIAAVCLSEIFALAGYSLIPALLPQFIDEWALTNTEGGWLAGSVFGGYMIAVLPLVSSTDRWPARSVYLASSLVGSLACFGLVLTASLIPAIAMRALAGIALAGMYMPGLRALTDHLEGTKRARTAAFYTSSFTIGTALSFLLGQIASLWSWRRAFVAAGLLGIASFLLAWQWLPRSQSGRPPLFTIAPALRNRVVGILIFAYAIAIWGSVGLRQWIIVFLAFCHGSATPEWSMLAAGALISLLGVPAALFGNELSLRFGLRNTGLFVFAASAVATGLFGLTARLPYAAVLVLSLAGGFVVQGNFANLTTGLLAAAERVHAGATMALYSCIGFGGGFLGTVVFGALLDWLGGSSHVTAWEISFGSCGLVCVLGAAAMIFLPRAPSLSTGEG